MSAASFEKAKRAKHCIHNARVLEAVGGEYVWIKDARKVVVLAIAGPWAMVRRPRCMPYVCPTKELQHERH